MGLRIVVGPSPLRDRHRLKRVKATATESLRTTSFLDQPSHFHVHGGMGPILGNITVIVGHMRILTPVRLGSPEATIFLMAETCEWRGL